MTGFVTVDTITRTDKFHILALEVQNYLAEMRKMRNEKEEKEGKKTITIDDFQLSRFFRERERESNTENILQYLISFAECLPDDLEAMREPVNPYQQFQEFVKNEINLLQDADVVEMILHEYLQIGIFPPEMIEKYKEKIQAKHLEIREIINHGKEHQGKYSLEPLLKALQQLCIFWFQIKQENPLVFRKNDIYIYNLSSRILYSNFFKPAYHSEARAR